MIPEINLNNFIEIDINSMILTVAEIVAIILIFVGIRFFLGKAYKQLIKVPSLKNKQKDIEAIYQNILILLTISCLILCFLVTGINGWLIFYQGENLIEYQISLVQSISLDYFIGIGIRLIKILGILILTKWSIPYINKLITWLKERTKNFDVITANDAGIEKIFEFLKGNFNNLVWLLYFTISAQIMLFPKVIIEYLYLSLIHI